MGVRYFIEPKLDKPDLIASWPGICNIGLVATDMLRVQIGAEPLAEIEPWDFFYPKKVVIQGGVLRSLDFPGSTFYYARLKTKDVIVFVGEEQPADGARLYAEGRKAYQIANLVLDVAERFGCRRVYASGAAVALSHHTLPPRVRVAAGSEALNREIRTTYANTLLMSERRGRGDTGSITGLNGLLLGMAKKRGLEAVCLMGEIPDYLSTVPLPYPRASRSVLDVLARILGITVDFGPLEAMAAQVDEIITGIYDKLPPEIRERVDQRKAALQPAAEAITEEDEKWISEHIDELFKKGGGRNERPT